LRISDHLAERLNIRSAIGIDESLSFAETARVFRPGKHTHRGDAAAEAAISRLYGGIHYRTANENGLAAGIGIGNWAFNHYLQPKGNRSRK
jgi:hypothetical protein